MTGTTREDKGEQWRASEVTESSAGRVYLCLKRVMNHYVYEKQVQWYGCRERNRTGPDCCFIYDYSLLAILPGGIENTETYMFER